MDNQLDQRRIHTPGHESHGVHVCSKCGWSYPNPHPSAKHRRAHKKICGTIEGYKLCVSDGQAHLNGSDDEHVFYDDHKKPGLVVSAPNNLDTDKIKKGNDGIGESLVRLRSEDDVFSDAVAVFSDSGLSPGVKEPLKQDSLDSGTTVAQVKDPELSESPKNSDFINDGSQLIVKSSDGYQIQNPNILPIESVEVGNALDLQGQLSGSIVDPLPSLIADLRTGESTFVHNNDFFDLSSDSHPSKAEALLDVFPENKINTGENAINCSLISVAKETNLIARDEIKSDVDVVENVDSSDNIVDETREGVSDIVSGAISLDHQVADEAVNLMEKNSAEFLSVRAQDDFPLELKSVEITNASINDFKVESARVKQFSTFNDVNILQEKGEVNGNADTPPTCDDSPEVAHPQSEYEGFKDPEGVVSQDPLSLRSYESLKRDEDDLNSVTEENTSVFNSSQLTEKSVVFSPAVHVVSSASSMKKELVKFEPMPEESHAEEHTEVTEENNFVFKPSQFTEKGDILSPDMHVVSSTNSMKKEPVNFENIETNAEENAEASPVKLTVECFDRLDEIGGSMNSIETEKNESHIIPFSEEQGTIDGCKYEGFKDPEGVVSQDPLSLHSYESLNRDEDDLNSVTEENTFVFNSIQLTGKSVVLSPDVHVVSSASSMKKELVKFEPMPEETHAEEHTEVTEENNFVFKPSQFTEKGDILSPDMHVVSSTNSMKKEPVNFENIETNAEENTEVSPVKLTVECFDRLGEIGGSMNSIETEKNESHIIPFSEEQGTIDGCKDLQQISLQEGSLLASSIETPRDASFASATSETVGVISIYNSSHHEKNRTEINDTVVDGNNERSNVENDIGTKTKDLQPSDLLQLEAKQSRDLVKSDDAGEMGKTEKSDITESPVISEAVVDGATRKAKALECTNGGPISAAWEDLEDEMNSNIQANEEYNRSVDPFADSYHVQDAELLVKAAENLSVKYTSPSLNTEPSAQDVSAVEDNRQGDPGGEVSRISAMPVQDRKDEINSNVKVHEEYSRSIDPSGDSHHAQDAELLMTAENLAAKYTSLSSLHSEPSTQHHSAAEDNQDGEQGGKVSGITAVPVQDRSVDSLVKHSSSGFDASVDSSSRCDSLEGQWGSMSVISLQSDAPAVIDTETLPSTGLLASTEAAKSNVNNPKDSFHRQQSGKSEMFEAPSFMTLVEHGHVVNPKAAASEVQKGLNPQHSDSTSQAGWFPTLTQVINESPGRKKNEEIIAKVTNWSTSKEHTPLKSLLGEAAHSNKAKSPKFEGHSLNQKNDKFPENSSSGLKTVNSILGPESPAAQAAKEWNSPARYPSDIKREKGKVKSRPFWIQLVCCSSVDHQPQRR